MKKISIITGASSGIGYEFARELASTGRDVLLVARSADKLKENVEKIKNDYNVEAKFISLDLLEIENVDELFEEVTKDYQVEILINNAGINTGGKFQEIEWKKIDDLISLNSRTPSKIMHKFIPHMLKGDKAYILNLCSLAYCVPIAFFGNYSASKSYLNMLSQSVNEELKGTNLSVTSSCPGAVRTDFIKSNLGIELAKEADALARNADYIAKVSLKAMFNGKPLIVPGIENVGLLAMRSILPTKWFNGLITWAYKKQVNLN